jgi:hypothetical protein
VLQASKSIQKLYQLRHTKVFASDFSMGKAQIQVYIQLRSWHELMAASFP